MITPVAQHEPPPLAQLAEDAHDLLARPFSDLDLTGSHPARRSVATESDLRSSIDRGELRLHYQPIVDLSTGVTVAAEALVRWERPIEGLLGPDAFLDLADATGFIAPMSAWVIDTAIAQLAAWSRDPVLSEVAISVNLSPRQLADTTLVETLRDALSVFEVAPERLHVEITETTLLPDDPVSTAVLGALRATGVGISIDDYGTGHASLSYLKRIPADTIKLDREFVRELPTSVADQAIVASTVELAHTLGRNVIAEGVETRDQLVLLQALGCDRGQGFWFGRPVSAEHFAPRIITI